MPRGVVSGGAWASSLAFFLTGLFPFFNADGYGHLAQGRQIAELGSVPTVDLFSFWQPTPQPWTNYEWAYDLGTWLVYDYLGANGLILLKCVGLGVLGYVLVWLAYRLAQGAILAGPLALTALLVVLPIARFRFTVRPQILGLVFPAILLLGVSTLAAEQSSRRNKGFVLVGLGLMHVVWVNTHGSHLFGVLITLIFLLFSWRTAAFRWMAALLALQIVVTGCTPFGFSIVTDAVSHLARPEFRDVVVEWAPWSPEDPLRLLIGPVVTSLLVLVALRPVARSGRLGLGYGVFCVLLCVMAFRSTRFVAHQVLFTAPFIAAGLSALPVVRDMRGRMVAVVALAILWNAGWTPQLVPAFGFGLGEARRDYPWGSAEVIDRGVKHARILATIQDSWMMMFAVPEGRFLVDGRVPFYGPAFIARISNSFAQPDAFAEQLTEFDVNTVVIDHTRADHIPATNFLSANPSWHLAFVEDGHSLFVRDNAAPSLEPLRIVGPGYRTGRLLEPGYSEAEVEAELSRLKARSNGSPIRGWLRGLQRLRPLARDGDRAGIRKSANVDEQGQARDAYALLTEAANVYPGFTSIELYRAMAALSACDIDEAREALGRATLAGETRGTALVGLELALRAGSDAEHEAVIEHLARLRAQP
ncbi:MAG: tetratricopeptide repeat protein, partial [Deltaproteobacteria bacterium]|nr:tetratricopeptide repeat protein [Deltaproteobacteria bacterium]